VRASLQEYDSDKKVPVYGFGGAFNGATHHIFPLTFDPSRPEVDGVPGVLDAYARSLQCVSLSGPTKFGQIIAQAASEASRPISQSSLHYTVLLIITDGVINDLDETIAQIVAASVLPLSIVIVGVVRYCLQHRERRYCAAHAVLTYSGGVRVRVCVFHAGCCGLQRHARARRRRRTPHVRRPADGPRHRPVRAVSGVRRRARQRRVVSRDSC
jgi:vacuolar-type H+-ATPase subunit F/Vma7